jgi:hypothetical protein
MIPAGTWPAIVDPTAPIIREENARHCPIEPGRIGNVGGCHLFGGAEEPLGPLSPIVPACDLLPDVERFADSYGRELVATSRAPTGASYRLACQFLHDLRIELSEQPTDFSLDVVHRCEMRIFLARRIFAPKVSIHFFLIDPSLSFLV